MTSMLPVRVAGTSTDFPADRRTTAEMAARLTPPRDAAMIESRTGIAFRHLVAPGDSPADYGARALRKALDVAGMTPEQLGRIMFVSSGGGDLLLPANANVVAARLGLAGTCDCFDVNNACMGFLTAFDLAARSVATGSGPVGIAVVEFPTRTITPDDPRPFLVFGDAGAAAVIVPAANGGGILGTWLRNDGIAFGNVRVENTAVTRRPTAMIKFTARNDQMGDEAIDAVRRAAAGVLAAAHLGIDDIEWILPHQPNGPLLAAIVDALRADWARVVPVVSEIGSVGAASVAVSLDRLFRTRDVRAGDRVLMVGVGAGLSSGAILYRHE